jgi:hypothetical protein
VQPTFPAQYSCEQTYTLHGTAYPSTCDIDSTNLQKVDQKANSKIVWFYSNKVKYSLTANWCSVLPIYTAFTICPAMAAAYQCTCQMLRSTKLTPSACTDMGTEVVGGVTCDKFGEVDQLANHGKPCQILQPALGLHALIARI